MKNNPILKITLCCVFLTLLGCATGSIKNKTTTTFSDGKTVTSTTHIQLPKYPSESTIYSNANGEYVNLPASQDQAGIDKIKQDSKNTRILYIGAGILILLGGIGLALPNQLVSNKDSLLVIGSGLVSFGVIRFVQASEQLMGYILPIIILCGVGYMTFMYIKNKKSN